jgi:hypothetical protein
MTFIIILRILLSHSLNFAIVLSHFVIFLIILWGIGAEEAWAPVREALGGGGRGVCWWWGGARRRRKRRSPAGRCGAEEVGASTKEALEGGGTGVRRWWGDVRCRRKRRGSGARSGCTRGRSIEPWVQVMDPLIYHTMWWIAPPYMCVGGGCRGWKTIYQVTLLYASTGLALNLSKCQRSEGRTEVMSLNTPTMPIDISAKLSAWKDNSNSTIFSNLHITSLNSIL